MPPTLISDFMSLQRKNYTNITFRARLVFVDPNVTSNTNGFSFRVIVSDHTQSMKGTFWSWDQDTFDFFCKNIQKIFEFNGTSLKIVKEERFALEHFLQFSLDKLDRYVQGFTGRFFVLPDCSSPEAMRFLTCIVPMSRMTTASPAPTIMTSPALTPRSSPSVATPTKRPTEDETICKNGCMLPRWKFCHIDGSSHAGTKRCPRCSMLMTVPFCGATLPGDPPVRHTTDTALATQTTNTGVPAPPPLPQIPSLPQTTTGEDSSNQLYV